MGNEKISGTKDNSKVDGGIRFTTNSSHPGVGSYNKFNASGGANSKSMNIDELLSVIGLAGNANGNSKETLLEVSKYISDAVDVANSSISEIKDSKKSKIRYCENCKKLFNENNQQINGNATPDDTITAKEHMQK